MAGTVQDGREEGTGARRYALGSKDLHMSVELPVVAAWDQALSHRNTSTKLARQTASIDTQDTSTRPDALLLVRATLPRGP